MQTKLLPLFLCATAGIMLVKAGMVFSTVTGLQPAAAIAQEAQPVETAVAAPAQDPPRLPRDLDALNRTEFQLLQDLRARRESLDERERQIDLQQTILAAKEQQIDKKIGRLETLESSIQNLVRAYNEQEDERLADLVQIYETMKPKDAARIFDQLELATQLDLATRISPRKMSAILAEMSSDQAKVLTTELARHQSLEEALADEAA
ncbi:MAG: MotE family protein [Rhodothalassiaceae bacterium]